MNNQVNNLQTRSYDLEERTALFAENVIHFVKKLKVDIINRSLIEQVVSSSGSIGANYCEANEAESKRDFIHKIGIAKKEVKETQYWLRILESSNISFKTETQYLSKEAHELLLIFSKIIVSSKK